MREWERAQEYKQSDGDGDGEDIMVFICNEEHGQFGKAGIPQGRSTPTWGEREAVTCLDKTHLPPISQIASNFSQSPPSSAFQYVQQELI